MQCPLGRDRNNVRGDKSEQREKNFSLSLTQCEGISCDARMPSECVAVDQQDLGGIGKITAGQGDESYPKMLLANICLSIFQDATED